MTSNDVISPAILDFTIFWKKSQEIKEINPKSSQNADKLYKFMYTTELSQKSWCLVRPTLNLIADKAASKMKDTIDISKFPHRIKEQPLKVPAHYNKMSFQKIDTPFPLAPSPCTSEGYGFIIFAQSCLWNWVGVCSKLKNIDIDNLRPGKALFKFDR